MTVIVKHTDDAASYRIYLDSIGAATISSATLAEQVPATSPVTAGDLTIGSATPDNTTSPKSIVVSISGGVHGKTYQIECSFVLSTGGTVVRTVPFRLFDS